MPVGLTLAMSGDQALPGGDDAVAAWLGGVAQANALPDGTWAGPAA